MKLAHNIFYKPVILYALFIIQLQAYSVLTKYLNVFMLIYTVSLFIHLCGTNHYDAYHTLCHMCWSYFHEVLQPSSQLPLFYSCEIVEGIEMKIFSEMTWFPVKIIQKPTKAKHYIILSLCMQFEIFIDLKSAFNLAMSHVTD